MLIRKSRRGVDGGFHTNGGSTVNQAVKITEGRGMALSDIKTTEWLLINWGRWAYANRGLSLNYSSIEPYERMRAAPPPEPAISDHEATVIDKAVSDLRVARPAEGEILALYYIGGKTYRSLGRDLGKHHAIVANTVDAGKMWVEGRIAGRF